MLLYLGITSGVFLLVILDALFGGVFFFWAPDVKAHLQKQDQEKVQLKRDLRKAQDKLRTAEKQMRMRYDQGRQDGYDQAIQAKSAVIRTQKEHIALLQRYVAPSVMPLVEAELRKPAQQQASVPTEPDWFAQSFNNRRH